MASNICDNCALRLFNDKCHCLEGVGNPNYGTLIVVPNVDYNAYKNKGMTFSKYVEIINKVLSSSTGGLEKYYVTPLIRCKLYDECPIDKRMISNCSVHTFRDICKYNFTKILLLGRASELINVDNIGDNINKIFIGNNTELRGYSVNYSPFIKYIDEDKFEVFKEHLIKWYNANKYNNYNGYEINVV